MVVKRALDLLASLCALVALAPLFAVIAAVLSFTGERKVFYRQERIGRFGEPFVMLKFATMTESGADEEYLVPRDDLRVLPVGRILRATKLNELPQLINVLRGDMSLIGPRPQVRPHFDCYPAHVRRQLIKVRPGLSGLASVFFRDEEAMLARHASQREEVYAARIAPFKAALELWYVRNQSIVLDLGLILLTAWVLVVPGTKLPSRLFPGLPAPPERLVI